ncbi:MAG: hypothetical protein IIC91_00210 [Chloroflexi bacterium]|nr:hypothetical protein [Chloroflexota bacterium]MCH8007269.1 hypothetical protein [Chloroflexota bacterium]
MAEVSRNELPGWAKVPFRGFRKNVIEIADVLHLACDGIAMLRARPQALEALAETDEMLREAFQLENVDEEAASHGEEAHEDPLADARRQAHLAQEEVEKNFPLLHAQAVISLWGSLEALIKNFLGAWIGNEPTARESQIVRKLKVPLWQFDDMSPDERNLFTVELLEREVNSTLRQGVTRFEAVLELFDLGGKVDEAVGKDIFEMGHVRNVLVHRRGMVDRRLLEACPWLEAKVGETLQITHQDFGRYYMSTTRYFFDVYNRVRKHFGEAPFVPLYLREAQQDDESSASSAPNTSPPSSSDSAK